MSWTNIYCFTPRHTHRVCLSTDSSVTPEVPRRWTLWTTRLGVVSETLDRQRGTVCATYSTDPPAPDTTQPQRSIPQRPLFHPMRLPDDADISETDIQPDADLRGVDLQNVTLQGGNLRGADLRGANLRGADLRGANLRGVSLDEACLRDAVLSGMTLRDGTLQNVALRSADLRGANLRDVTLQQADLRDTTLEDAGFQDVTLRDADLRGASLKDADLYEVDLGGADISCVDLRGAKFINCNILGLLHDDTAVDLERLERLGADTHRTV
jgi:hypothetical protein